MQVSYESKCDIYNTHYCLSIKTITMGTHNNYGAPKSDHTTPPPHRPFNLTEKVFLNQFATSQIEVPFAKLIQYK